MVKLVCVMLQDQNSKEMTIDTHDYIEAIFDRSVQNERLEDKQ